MSTGAIEKEALALPLEDRARLAEKLLESLDNEISSPLSEAWKEEIERRRQEVRQGKVKPVAGEEVSRKAWGLVKSAAR
ncbi:MAG: addiction module protein [Verrucomicrobiota bacterium]|jgi:putative addiction module component (TIGR02574 family)